MVSQNIKFLRKRAGYTQETLANELGIKRSLIGAYEEGRADPRLNNLQNIAKLFGVTLDQIISEDLSIVDPQLFGVANQATARGNQSSIKVLAITVDKTGNENIELVPQKASAGYLNGYSDPEYLSDLPDLRVPGLSGGTFRAFEITGDSMLPLKPSTLVIGRYVESVNDIKNGKTYVLLSESEGVVFKRVFNYIEERGKLFLVSDNKSYQPYELNPEDVLEVWEASAYLSLEMPDGSTESGERLSFDQLKDIVLDLQHQVIQLKEKKNS